MSKRLLLFICCILFSLLGFAQGKVVKGKVSDENGAPLAGVTVMQKSTKKAVQTDANGNFSITLSGVSEDLVFTYVGFKAITINTGGRENLSVSLTREIASSEEVVVIGYQTVKRKDLLASVSSVSAKDLKDIPINSVAEALNGRLAGVTATTSEGSPDAAIRIRVRGGMSITGDNTPLYIVDGVQVEDGLNSISPQDIQTIDVLKDAAATAIYGARGANGVVVITTKSGRPGRTIVSYNGFVGVKNLAKELDVLSPYDYVIYQSERSRGSNTDSTNFATNFGTTWDTLSNYKNVAPVSWQDKVFGNTGVATTHNVNANGGTNKYSFNFGYTYNDDKAVVINSKYSRHLFNLKGDYKITKNLKIGLGGRLTHQDVVGAGVSSDQGSSYSRLRNAVKYRPFLSSNQDIDDEDALADPNVGNGLNLYNPISLANSEYRKKTTDVYNITASLSYTITKNLSFKSTFGYDNYEFKDRQFYDSITPFAIIQGGRKPIVRLDTTNRQIFTNSNVFIYSVKNFRKKHDFDFLAGEETYDLRNESRSSLFRDFPLNISSGDAFKNTTLGNSFTGYPKLAKSRYTNLSFFSRINYSYKDRYLMSFNFRADGASKFKPGLQWGYFPSASVAWRVKKEKFLENVDFINDLKFRVGVGTVGNNRIGDYLFLTTFANDGRYYYGINNEPILAYYPSALVNEKLKWESTVSRNLGMDLAFFKNRFNLSVDIYNNDSKDLLLNVPIASTYGYTTQYQNIGKTNNKGIEIQLNAALVRKAHFTWNANFNISHNRNEIKQLGVNQTQFFPAASWGVSGQPTDYITRIGDPVSSIWGLVTDGFYKVSDFDYNTTTSVYTLKTGTVTNAGIIGTVQPGSIRFKDLNGDGIIDVNNDRQIIGNPNPKFSGGLNQQFTYKNWDASVFVNFSYGGDVYNANKIEFTNGYTANANMLTIMEGRWKVVTEDGRTAQYVSGGNVIGISPSELEALNANATIWQPIRGSGAFYPHSWAIEDGSYLRLNNVTIGYSFPVSHIAGIRMSKLRLYVTGNNLAVITNYSGYDPEVNVRVNNPLTQGLDYSAYPKSRSFIFGVNASF